MPFWPSGWKRVVKPSELLYVLFMRLHIQLFYAVILLGCSPTETATVSETEKPMEVPSERSNLIAKASMSLAERFISEPASDWENMSLRVKDLILTIIANAILADKADPNSVTVNIELAKLHAEHCVDQEARLLGDSGLLSRAFRNCLRSDDLHFQIEKTAR